MPASMLYTVSSPALAQNIATALRIAGHDAEAEMRNIGPTVSVEATAGRWHAVEAIIARLDSRAELVPTSWGVDTTEPPPGSGRGSRCR
jgi:hypothetical protein